MYNLVFLLNGAYVDGVGGESGGSFKWGVLHGVYNHIVCWAGVENFSSGEKKGEKKKVTHGVEWKNVDSGNHRISSTTFLYNFDCWLRFIFFC